MGWAPRLDVMPKSTEPERRRCAPRCTGPRGLPILRGLLETRAVSGLRRDRADQNLRRERAISRRVQYVGPR
jgi:hypothetical protein